MYRTFSIRESLMCGLRVFKNNIRFFFGFSFLWGVCGLLALFGLSYLQLPEGMVIKAFEYGFSLVSAFLSIWLFVAMTHVALHLHRNEEVSYSDLLLSPRVILMGAIVLLVIGVGIWAVHALFYAPVIFKFVTSCSEFGICTVLQLLAFVAVCVFLSRVLFSLFVVVDSEGNETNPLARSIAITRGNSIKLIILCALILSVPWLATLALESILVFLFSVGLGSAIIFLFSNIYAALIIAPLFSAISTMWFLFTVLVVSHAYKQLNAPDEMMNPSAFVN